MTCRKNLFSYNIVGLHTHSLKATCAIRMGGDGNVTACKRL